jgi:uncharacterized protein
MVGRLLVWQVTESAGFESAWVRRAGRALAANGRSAGQLPEPYWVSYELETDRDIVTSRLRVTVESAGATRQLDLRRADGWSENGAARPDLDAALDCDLGFCPLTNTMPVLRSDLHRRPGTAELTVAFVKVPSLEVVAAHQTYTHLGLVGGTARVRYSSGTFSSDLVVDDEGFVVDYPGMAHRVSVPSPGQ